METTDEVYSKVEYERDMARCQELKLEALHLVSEEKMSGFLLWETEAVIKTFEENCKARWARSQALLGALRVNKIKLAREKDLAEIAKLTRKVRYLKMLAGRILAGTDPLKAREPLGTPKEWPWVRMINGWQRVVLE